LSGNKGLRRKTKDTRPNDLSHSVGRESHKTKAKSKKAKVKRGAGKKGLAGLLRLA
jgi:hypothetical protein